MSRGQRFPLLTRSLSVRRLEYRSENHDILQVLAKMEGSVSARPLWVMGRGVTGVCYDGREQETVRFGLTRVCLQEHPEQQVQARRFTTLQNLVPLAITA